MIIQGIDHISINVIDYRKSVDFYGKILGFKQMQTVDCGDFDIMYFSIPGGGRLELFDYHGKSKQTLREESEVGLRHLAFQVSGVSEKENLLREAGVEIALPTTDLPNLEARVMLFKDPNGVVLEFCEKLS